MFLPSYLLTVTASVVTPPSPTQVPDLINNAFLEPDVYRYFTGFDESKAMSKGPKPRLTPEEKLAKYKAKNARQTILNKINRDKIKSLPDGDPKKEAKRERERLYSQTRRAMFKNLPDGDERKEEYLQNMRRYSGTRYWKMRNLPDGDETKQKYLESRKASRKKYVVKKKLEKPNYFKEKERKRIRLVFSTGNPAQITIPHPNNMNNLINNPFLDETVYTELIQTDLSPIEAIEPHAQSHNQIRPLQQDNLKTKKRKRRTKKEPGSKTEPVPKTEEWYIQRKERLANYHERMKAEDLDGYNQLIQRRREQQQKYYRKKAKKDPDYYKIKQRELKARQQKWEQDPASKAKYRKKPGRPRKEQQ